jgi:DNA-binding NarL/FixJ family response regulator
VQKFVAAVKRDYGGVVRSLSEKGAALISSRARVLIAEDHVLVAELYKTLLEKEHDVSIVRDGLALVRVAAALGPDVAIVDINLPLLNGLDAGQRAKRQRQGLKLVYVTVSSDRDTIIEAFRRGASAYLLKTCTASELALAVRAVLRGNRFVSRGIPKEVIEYPALISSEESTARLTGRQVEVLQLLAEGRPMKEVGSILNMATRTVAFHKYRMMEKLGIKSSAELVRYAVRNRMVA